ncbi:MAG: 4Fe-4S dicluster domain-containing protein [Thermoanaerobaculia bacterium]
MSPSKWFSVHFRNQQDSCIECDACDNVCPVDLQPRDLSAAVGERPGLSVAGAPGRNHCLECGDCVRACEWMIERCGDGPVPLLLDFFSGPQRVDAAHSGSEERLR